MSSSTVTSFRKPSTRTSARPFLPSSVSTNCVVTCVLFHCARVALARFFWLFNQRYRDMRADNTVRTSAERDASVHKKQSVRSRIPLAEISLSEADARPARIDAPPRRRTDLPERQRRAVHRVTRFPGRAPAAFPHTGESQARASALQRRDTAQRQRESLPHDARDAPRVSSGAAAHCTRGPPPETETRDMGGAPDAPPYSSDTPGPQATAQRAGACAPLSKRSEEHPPVDDTVMTRLRIPRQLYTPARGTARTPRAERGARMIR